jgi:predicted RNA binding protein YcfA (HicA-like mRNA interferase family)
MNASVLITILENAGWVQTRQRGNHRIFIHTNHPNLISIPDLEEKNLNVGLLNDIFREAGLPCRIHKLTLSPTQLWKGLLNALRITQ